MTSVCCRIIIAAACITLAAAMSHAQSPAIDTRWQPVGWGGGGLYWAAAFDPSRDGVIYMGGDVAGVYKTEDHGKHWRLINDGLADYGVYALAVDPQHPSTVYAATIGGLCKSVDGGEHWRLLPRTGPKDLRITGERNLSTGCIAVDPTNSDIVYAASPTGKVYKSIDGGESWLAAYETTTGADDGADMLRARIGKVNGDFHAGFWFPIQPAGDANAKFDAMTFRFAADGNPALNFAAITLTTADGGRYRSRSMIPHFDSSDWQNVTLTADDFEIDPTFVEKNAEKAKLMPARPNFESVSRLDFVAVGSLPQQTAVVRFGPMSFVAGAERVVVKDISADAKCFAYGNIRLGRDQPGTVQNIAISPKNPSMVVAATRTRGLVLSEDAGSAWRPLTTPARATSVAISATDAALMFATFAESGVYKSTDAGRTWSPCNDGIKSKMSMTRVVIDPTDAQRVFAIGTINWNGAFYASDNGGQSWREVRQITADYEANPTADGNFPPKVGLSKPTDLAVNPANPRELFITANWRPCRSDDGGETLVESDRGADISCIYDIRFHKNRVYVTAMDEGAFVSEDNGQSWRQLWPRKYSEFSGHYWRVAITPRDGGDRIVTTCSPWMSNVPDGAVVSEDSGKTFAKYSTGLPAQRPRANTMWGEGFCRALAVDPNNPDVMYMGIDGDASGDHTGGGLFKSIDAGRTWKQLPNQPDSRRVFFGLAVDPADSNRLYWGACGSGGGIYRSDDAGRSWQHVFKHETWVFNLLLAADGTVYAASRNLWRSTDRGRTWKKLTDFTDDQIILGLEVDPRDPATLWFSRITWDSAARGDVYRTRDAGATWQTITGDLPYRKPMLLRFNPNTNDLWAAGVGLFKTPQ